MQSTVAAAAAHVPAPSQNLAGVAVEGSIGQAGASHMGVAPYILQLPVASQRPSVPQLAAPSSWQLARQQTPVTQKLPVRQSVTLLHAPPRWRFATHLRVVGSQMLVPEQSPSPSQLPRQASAPSHTN